LTWGPEQDFNTTRIMKVMLAKGKPDLVVFTGDCITGNNIGDNAVKRIIKSKQKHQQKQKKT